MRSGLSLSIEKLFYQAVTDRLREYEREEVSIKLIFVGAELSERSLVPGDAPGLIAKNRTSSPIRHPSEARAT